MKRPALAAIAIVLATTHHGIARADGSGPAGPPREPDDRLRELYEQGDYAGVRRELLAQYRRAPRPPLLFALGQVELNLGNYREAIAYYEKFIATSPADDQIALAQQAIGAARMRLAQPGPPAKEPVRGPPRRWSAEDTGLVALGGTAIVVGAGLVLYGRALGNDRTGSLAAYDARIDQARASQWSGAGIAAAGTLVIGAALLRWRLRPDRAVITASVSATRGAIGASWAW